MDNSISPNAIIMLLKFIQNKPKYINDFKKGNLYFSSLQSFVDMELKQNNCKTGDKNEGNIHQIINDLEYLKIADREVPLKDIKNFAIDRSMPKHQKNNLGICSFFAVQFKDLERVDRYSNKYRLKKNVLEDLYKTKDGNRVLFAVNNVRRLQKECRENLLDYGLVKYYDPNHISKLEKILQHKEFYKTIEYSFQHEFRIEKNLSDKNNFKHLDSIEEEQFRSNFLCQNK